MHTDLRFVVFLLTVPIKARNEIDHTRRYACVYATGTEVWLILKNSILDVVICER